MSACFYFCSEKSTLRQREKEGEWICGISTQSNENNSENRKKYTTEKQMLKL